METRLRRAGRERRVTLAAETDGWTATLDGVLHRIVRLADAGGSELVLEIDGRPVRALVARRGPQVLVALGGVTYAFEVGDEARADDGAGAGSGTVTAPMPGKVVAVLVAVGDAVAAGQPLVVLEAMKMETTLAAEVAGTVDAVHAVVGGMADAGAVLVTIAPAS